MKITKYICANSLAVLGNLALFSFLYSLLFDNFYDPIYQLILQVFGFYYDTYLFIIIILLLLLPIEILLNKLFHNKFVLNLNIRNKNLRQIYSVMFWLGLICSILYVLFLCYIIIIL